MKRIYLYKMVCDNGGAPCVQHGLLSLAICKPKIRNKAKKGDLLLGFVGKTMKRKDDRPPAGALIYAARITDVLCATEYYDGRYQGKRNDAIYRWNGSDFECLKNDFHEPDDKEHDLGKCPDQSKVLLSSDYRYFGRSARMWPHYQLVNDCISKLMQGHRVNHSNALADELDRLENEVWEIPNPGDCEPIQEPDLISVSDEDEGSCVVKCRR